MSKQLLTVTPKDKTMNGLWIANDPKTVMMDVNNLTNIYLTEDGKVNLYLDDVCYSYYRCGKHYKTKVSTVGDDTHKVILMELDPSIYDDCPISATEDIFSLHRLVCELASTWKYKDRCKHLRVVRENILKHHFDREENFKIDYSLYTKCIEEECGVSYPGLVLGDSTSLNEPLDEAFLDGVSSIYVDNLCYTGKKGTQWMLDWDKLRDKELITTIGFTRPLMPGDEISLTRVPEEELEMIPAIMEADLPIIDTHKPKQSYGVLYINNPCLDNVPEGYTKLQFILDALFHAYNRNIPNFLKLFEWKE